MIGQFWEREELLDSTVLEMLNDLKTGGEQ